MSHQENLDEFDRIILQISFLKMFQNVNAHTEINNFEEILNIFRNRSSRKDFPAISFIAYIQFAMVTGEGQAMEGLI